MGLRVVEASRAGHTLIPSASYTLLFPRAPEPPNPLPCLRSWPSLPENLPLTLSSPEIRVHSGSDQGALQDCLCSGHLPPPSSTHLPSKLPFLTPPCFLNPLGDWEENAVFYPGIQPVRV